MRDLSDAEREVALDYCVPLGIPLSIFCGRVPKPGEPYWLTEDFVAVLNWKTERCDGCKKKLADTVGDKNYDAWNARIDGYCDVCRAMSRAVHAASGRDELDPLAGARLRIWRDEEVS